MSLKTYKEASGEADIEDLSYKQRRQGKNNLSTKHRSETVRRLPYERHKSSADTYHKEIRKHSRHKTRDYEEKHRKGRYAQESRSTKSYSRNSRSNFAQENEFITERYQTENKQTMEPLSSKRALDFEDELHNQDKPKRHKRTDKEPTNNLSVENSTGEFIERSTNGKDDYQEQLQKIEKLEQLIQIKKQLTAEINMVLKEKPIVSDLEKNDNQLREESCNLNTVSDSPIKEEQLNNRIEEDIPTPVNDLEENVTSPQINNLLIDSKINSPISNIELSESNAEDDLDISNLPPYYPAIQGCRSVSEFHILNHINEGTYGIVYRAKDKLTKDIVALKRLKMEREKEGFPITSLREINTLLKGQHPNIVTVREIVVGNSMDKIFIVMDYVEHDMKALIELMRSQNQSFTAAEIKCLLKQLLSAVAHLHDNWILHRDLKTSNLLLSNKGILKVGDFGLAREYGSPLKQYTPTVVTLWYRAPELLLGLRSYSTHIDVWSVGCIFGEFALMTPVFQGKTEIEQINRIFKVLGTPNETSWPGFKKFPVVKNVKLAQYANSNLRSRFHMLSVQGQALLQQLLTFDPTQRITAEDAVRHPYFDEFPLAIDPSMFPTWPSKHDIRNLPSNKGDDKKMEHGADNAGFHISMSSMDNRKLPTGGGFNLKF